MDGDAKLADPRLTVDEFHDLARSRPDEVRWELIDGDAVLNASPSGHHQIIVIDLGNAAEAAGASWIAMPGIAAARRDGPYNAPEPDVVVVPGAGAGWKTYDQLCVFEVISPESRSRDLGRTPALYQAIPSIQDCVVVAQDRCEVVHYSREGGWTGARVTDKSSSIQLAIGVELSVARIYRRTTVG